MQLIDLRDRILNLLPPGTQATQERWTDIPQKLTLSFDPTCAGSIERHWPAIFVLCEECGCEAVLISQDLLRTMSVLDTRSGAPNYTTECETDVSLVLRQAQTERKAA